MGERLTSHRTECCIRAGANRFVVVQPHTRPPAGNSVTVWPWSYQIWVVQATLSPAHDQSQVEHQNACKLVVLLARPLHGWGLTCKTSELVINHQGCRCRPCVLHILSIQFTCICCSIRSYYSSLLVRIGSFIEQQINVATHSTDPTFWPRRLSSVL